MNPVAWFQWHGQEKLASIFARIFWPPASAVAIIEQDGEILALDTGSYVMPPGGKVDYMETFEDAVVREVEEETGYVVNVEEKIDSTINTAGGNEFVFRCSVEERRGKSNWEGVPVWLSQEEAKERQWRFDRDIEKYLEQD